MGVAFDSREGAYPQSLERVILFKFGLAAFKDGQILRCQGFSAGRVTRHWQLNTREGDAP